MNPFAKPKERPARPSTSCAAGMAVLSLLLLITIQGSVLGLPLRIEAEHHIAYEDMDNPIFDPNHPDNNASNQHAVDGFNRAGQWCLYELTIEGPTLFSTYIRSGGSLGLVREYHVSYLNYSEEVIVTDTLFTGPGLSEGT
jgi:hypothetical protein